MTHDDTARTEAAVKAVEELAAERAEIDVGTSLDRLLVPLTDLDRADVASGANAIDRHGTAAPHQTASKPHVGEWATRHPDSRVS